MPVAKDAKKKPKEKKDARKDRPPKKSERPRDVDAVQLFRRYDRARAGVLLRADFLQLLRDYARPPAAASRTSAAQRLSLSLTDSNGIPLGYERSGQNSEFEAGQLFERYDKDHAGTLSLDKFHDFFFDFQTQLRAFVDDLSYGGDSASSDKAVSTPPREPVAATIPEHPRHAETPRLSPTSLRADYQAALWELRKLCRDELQQQRGRMRAEMDRIRDQLNVRANHTGSEPDNDLWSARDRQLVSRWSWKDNQLADRYDSVESDLHRVDEILRDTRRQLRIGMGASTEEMQGFISLSQGHLASARELAMNDYNVGGRDEEPQQTKRRGQQERSPRGGREQQDTSSDTEQNMGSPTPIQGDHMASQATVEQFQRQLLIKDQLIYQLLQERSALRKQKASVESDLQELSHVSTDEMRKWARLTDEMQEEIAALQGRLKSLEHHDRR